MKKIFLLVAIIATVVVKSTFALSISVSSLSSLLSSYYDIKNALINSDVNTAASKAGYFVKEINSIDVKSLSESDTKVFMEFQEKLIFDARHISENKDIAHQREHFANFSANFYKLAKAIKLTNQAIYYDYCPMQKGYWLSADAVIKNPYFGKQMLTCGKITETLNK